MSIALVLVAILGALFVGFVLGVIFAQPTQPERAHVAKTSDEDPR